MYSQSTMGWGLSIFEHVNMLLSSTHLEPAQNDCAWVFLSNLPLSLFLSLSLFLTHSLFKSADGN